MKQTIATPHLAFKTRRLRAKFSEQLCCDNRLVQDVAGPLFDAGILTAAITERANYYSGRAPVGMKGRIYHNLRLLLQGELHVEMGGQSYALSPGDLLVCPAGVPFRCHTAGNRAWWLYFHIEDLPAWEPIKTHGGYVRSYESAPLLFLLLRETLDAAKTHEPVAMRRARRHCRALVEQLRLEMIQGGAKPSRQVEALHDLVEAVAAAPEEVWSRETMAARLHVSVRQLNRLFKRELGVSPQEVVIRQRMKVAIGRLINTNLKVEVIALELGYDSLHSFTRLFTRHVGDSPGRYRERYGHGL